MDSSQSKRLLQGSRNYHDLFELLVYQVGKIVTPAHATCSIPPLHDFLDILVHRSRTRTGTLLVALVLLTRLSQRLGHITTGMATSPQRIILASLIISTKLIHDTSPKNIYWKEFANDYFELNEINLMEKQLLTLLDFNLSISYTDFQNAVHWYQQSHSSSNSSSSNNNNNKTWRWWWRRQETPEDVDQNVVANNNASTITKAPLLPTLLSSPSPISASSPSSLQSISLSTTPTFDLHDTSPAYFPLGPMFIHGGGGGGSASVCDMVGSSWSNPTAFVTPLFSV